MHPGPEHVGRRLSVRHRLPGGSATDVVGRLLAVDARTLLVQRRDGVESVVALADVVAWRTVPDRPRRSRSATSTDPEDLTRITSRGWPALESVALGEWELRASEGFTGRANSVAVHGEPGTDVATALRTVRDFYAARDLPALAQVVVGSAWERRLRERGWVPTRGQRPGAVVQVADLPHGAPAPPADPEVVVDPVPHDDWWSLYHRVDEATRVAAQRVMTGSAVTGFVRLGDPVLAIGRVVVTGEWAGLAAVEVVPSHRRRGLGRRVVTAALGWATVRGADKAYLQTMRENVAALSLYRPLGFVDHHEYLYLEAGPAPLLERSTAAQG